MTMTTTFLYAGYLRRYSAAPVSDDLICTGMSPTSVSIVISTPFKSASGPAIAAPLNHLGFFACSSLRAFSVLFSVARPRTICENAMAQSPLSSATVTREGEFVQVIYFPHASISDGEAARGGF